MSKKQKTVKNISDKDLFVRGIGEIKSGDEKKVPVDFNNANFKRVKDSSGKSKGSGLKVENKLNK